MSNTLDIVGIGNQRIKYPDPKECEFESSVDDYILIARKMISYFGPKLNLKITQAMLKSDDIVSNIATQIMFADWRWKPNYKNKNGTIRTKYSYRNYCGMQAINSYMTRNAKRIQKGEPFLSLNIQVGGDDSDTNDLVKILEDTTTPNPGHTIEQKEQTAHLRKKLDEFLSCGVLTDQQKKFVYLHYLDGKTVKQVAIEHGISREAVRQVISRAICKLQNLPQEQKLWALEEI